MKNIILTTTILLGLGQVAHAQGYVRVPNCGDARPPAGASSGYMDAHGNICSSSSGGSGGAVSIADGADVAEGAKADAAWTTGSGSVVALLKAIATKAISSIAVTQSGSWVLSAGSSIIGKVSIDQSTPGTTNGVQVNAALPAGSNVIGHVINDTGSTTAVTGTVAANTAQVNGVTTSTGTGAVGTGTQRVAIGTDTATVAGSTPNPCQANALLYAPISQAANAKYISAVSAKKNYICSITIIAADAENVSLVGGTGSTCGTNTEAVIGGATAANGPNLAANGGFTHGNGSAPIAAGATTNEDVCLFQSGSGRVAGVLTYVQQ